MGSIEAQKPHVVCIPYPSQGHVNPMTQLAKLLHSKGFHITFVNTEFNHRRLVRSKGAEAMKGFPDFRFENIPDGLPQSDQDATQDIPALCDSTRKNCLAPLLELITKLNSSDVPPVTYIVSDGVMSFGIEAGRLLGIPEFQFWNVSACGFISYEKFVNDGTLDTPIDWIPAMSNMRLKDIPSFIRTIDPNDIMFDFMGTEAQNCLKSSAIIFNTFDELEHEVLEAIVAKFPRIYTLGPLNLLGRHVPERLFSSLRSSLWKEDTNCIEWLNQREPKSVVYVNYGSVTVMSDYHLKEFAWGLANSKNPFLWIVRPDVVMGESAVLPEEFFEEVKDRGFITSWCPQDRVLSHGSVGVFLTHCWWNSTLESISGGLPVICWPFFAEQQTNCRFACSRWVIGVEVNPNVYRDDVAALVKEMMEGENGKKKKKKALEWREKAHVATDVGGSSYNNFDRFIEEVRSIPVSRRA
ncbi:hypothetical protein Goshw_023008 [Gossypium schwendimanii]|uniref:Glycosyltransferase n=1 Tax=Gossypium schwendimanii TaxID=34291 RepID=A0A7J9LQ96_GOSSC|nr:hypothetical protein [Gossypium schwendimanii]